MEGIQGDIPQDNSLEHKKIVENVANQEEKSNGTILSTTSTTIVSSLPNNPQTNGKISLTSSGNNVSSNNNPSVPSSPTNNISNGRPKSVEFSPQLNISSKESPESSRRKNVNFGEEDGGPAVLGSPRKIEGSDTESPELNRKMDKRLSKRISVKMTEKGGETPHQEVRSRSDTPQLGEGASSPKRLRRRLTEKGLSFIESGDEATERQRAKSKPVVLEHKRNLIGEIIYKKHPSWELMMNIQTGIRQSVGKSGELYFKDEVDNVKKNLSTHHKFYTTPKELPFPPEGSAETQPHGTGLFKFKDYCPLVFRHLREKFKVDTADYMVSLCNTLSDGSNALRELPTPGKSGSLFFFSSDMKYIVKTIPKRESKLLRFLLPKYYKHVMENTHTLLPRFFGLHRVKPHRGSHIRIVIMGNVFATNKKIHEKYDLKGSTFGRAVTEAEKASGKSVTYKDVDWRAKEMKIELAPELAVLFKEQLERDCEFLREMGIMDYSLLIGIHNCDVNDRRDCTRHCYQKRQPNAAMPVSLSNPLLNPPSVITAPGDEIQKTVAEPIQVNQVTLSMPQDQSSSASSGPSTNSNPPLSSSTTTTVETNNTTQPTIVIDGPSNLDDGVSVPEAGAPPQKKGVAFDNTSNDQPEKPAQRPSNVEHEDKSTSNEGGFFSNLTLRKKSTADIQQNGIINATLRRTVIGEKPMAQTNYALPTEYQSNDVCIFQRDDGGMIGTNPKITYFIAVIDILMLYTLRKKLEHSYKAIVLGAVPDEISAVKPSLYADRFLDFVHDITSGGETVQPAEGEGSIVGQSGEESKSVASPVPILDSKE
eukprot:TRINITY_DN4597_c0_g1_i3.p1 TRINITY_DN4597_c0_g1~~TRINITY_DN4597_c0_g1_i3.p1  ORF type:complete len:819 (+),score=308.58 TRINITY_DN4597_c0_g1_i3:128-2584(+)